MAKTTSKPAPFTVAELKLIAQGGYTSKALRDKAKAHLAHAQAVS